MHTLRRITVATTLTVTALSAVPALADAASPSATATPSPATVAAAHTTATPTTTDPAKGAAGWLARQLTGTSADHYLYPGSTYPADGPTIDGVLAMDAAHVAQTAAARATTYLESDATNYTSYNGFYYPGALGKLGLLAVAQGVDPTHFGGLDIVTTLQATEGSDGGYVNSSDPGYDSSSVTDQSLAILFLLATGVPADAPDAKALTWLEGRQCADGGFIDDPTKTVPATCTEADTTGFGAQALFAAGGSDPTALAAAKKAAGWLRAHQGSTGGWGSPADANDTALAVQGLLAAGDSASLTAAGKGIAFLESLQYGATAATAQRGAFRLNVAGSSPNLLASTQAAQAVARGYLGHITKAGAVGAAPILAAPVVTSPSPSVSRSPSTSPSPTTTSGSSTGSAAGTPTLPMTGSRDTATLSLVALWLLCAGLTTVLLARRRRGVS